MPFKALIVFSFLILGSIQAWAIDRNNMECMIFPTSYILNSDGSVTQTPLVDPPESKVKENVTVEVALVPDSDNSSLHSGQYKLPVGDSGQYELRISSSLTVNADDPDLDHITNKAYLWKKDSEGKFSILISKEVAESSAGDTSNSGLSLIATQSVLRNTEFDEAMRAYGLDLDAEIMPYAFSDDQYKDMVKKIPLAPKTLAYIRVNCAVVRLKGKDKSK